MIKTAEKIGPVTRSSAVCAAIANGHERAIEEAQREAAEAMREAAARECEDFRDGILLIRGVAITAIDRRCLAVAVETTEKLARAIRALKLEVGQAILKEIDGE